MSDLDLSAAVEAAGEAVAWMAQDWYCPKHPDTPRYACGWCSAEIAVAAAAPLIEAQVRARVAAEIRAETMTDAEELAARGDHSARHYNQGLADAARIARG